MNILKLCRKNNKLLLSVIFISLISILNNVEGFIFSKFGFSYPLLITEFLSLIVTVIFIHFLICMIEDGKCTTLKQD